MEISLSLRQLVDRRHKVRGNASRRCGFECLEPRQLLAADLAGGAEGLSYGFTGGSTGSISGTVFSAPPASRCDAHNTTAGLAEVRVQLLSETGTVLEESRTDQTGAYLFADLIPGEYAVRQIAQHAQLAGEALEGASYVGDGGGIALDANLVSEIAVQAGETQVGYDFCEFATTPELAGPKDRPIVPHGRAGQDLPFLSLSLQSPPSAQPSLIAEPSVELVVGAAPSFAPAPLNVSRPAEVFGGSSRSLSEPEDIKDWEDAPFDSLFSTASFLELAAAELPTLDTFEPILNEPLLSETDDISDAPFADGYTVDSLEGWKDEALFELDQLMGDEEIIDLHVETAEQAELVVPKIAHVYDAS